MKKLHRFCTIVTLLAFCLEACDAQPSKQNLAITFPHSISLPGVSGRIDHLAFDSSTKLLFIAALGNNSVEVVDLKMNKVIHTITSLSEPQGIAFIPKRNFIVVANGGNGTCDFFNADNYQIITSIQLARDADNVRYDPSNDKVYVGYGEGGIVIIDVSTLKLETDIKLQGHPESFQLDISAKKIYVNVPDKQQIEVIDLDKKVVIDRWKLKEAKANFPMALDMANHRLFIGCRHPAKLLVLDTETGKLVTIVDIDGDTDDIFYNAANSSIYTSCGDGYLDIIKQLSGNQYSQTEKIYTRSGARTSLFINHINRLIIAAPKRLVSNAELLVYDAKKFQ